MSALDAIGWAATGLFAASYLIRDPRRLRLVQAGAALVWIVYGVLLGAAPVVGANAAVAAIALLSLRRTGRETETE
ncbi:MAG: YgjV family protein [Acidobacteriota bacterium]